jgi:hypothetical protein
METIEITILRSIPFYFKISRLVDSCYSWQATNDEQYSFLKFRNGEFQSAFEKA